MLGASKNHFSPEIILAQGRTYFSTQQSYARWIGTGLRKERQVALQFRKRLPVPFMKPVEQVAPVRVGERFEDGVHLVHRLAITRYLLVTCQPVRDGIPRHRTGVMLRQEASRP